MSLNENELNQMKLVMVDVIKPIEKKIDSVCQTIHGTNGENGLCQRMMKLEEKVDDLRLFKKQVYTVVGTVQAIGIGVMALVKKLF